MTTKTAALTGAAVLLLGAGTYAFFSGSKNDAAGTSRSAATSESGSRSAGSSDSDLSSGAGSTRTERAKQEQTFPDLVSRYGDSRTKLSHHVSLKFLGLIDDVAGLAEMAKGHKGFDMGRRGLGALPDKLSLTPEQVTSAEKLLDAHQEKEMEKLKDISAELRKNPDDLMEALLASDAYARKQITEEEYQNITKQASEDLGKLFGGMPGGNRNAGNPLVNDPALRKDFNALLSSEQQQNFQTMTTEADQKAAETAQNPQPLQMPLGDQAMELEKMDQTLTSASTMMKGVQQMMEGAMSMPPDVLQGGKK